MKSSVKVARDWDGKSILRLRVYDSQNYDMDEDLRDQTFFQFILKMFPQPYLRQGIGWLTVHPRCSNGKTSPDGTAYEFDIYPIAPTEIPDAMTQMKIEYDSAIKGNTKYDTLPIPIKNERKKK